MNKYIECKISKDDRKINPFEFLLKRHSGYPDLAIIACELLATLASSAPVEMIFSSSGEVTRGKRNRLTNHNLET